VQASATDDLVTTPSIGDNQKNFSVSITDPPVRITQEYICENNPNVDYTRYFWLWSIPSIHWRSFEAGLDLPSILWRR